MSCGSSALSANEGHTFVLDRGEGQTYSAVTRYLPRLNDMTKARTKQFRM